MLQDKPNCKATDTSNTKGAPVVNQDRNELYDYNIETLQSYTNYTIAISCVNIKGTGERRKTTVQTNMTGTCDGVNVHSAMTLLKFD